VSMTLVLNQIETHCASLTGLSATRVWQGAPEPMPATLPEYPIVVITADAPTFRQLTMSDGGKLEARYTVTMALYLGPTDMRAQDAHAAMLAWPARFRARFAPDGTLTGTCWDSELGAPLSNLKDYKLVGEQPKIEWRLAVVEHTTVDAAA
jgi:hypothetical protein